MPFRALEEKDFFGRGEELRELVQSVLGAEAAVPRRIFLAGARGIGKTELLKQIFHHLFWKQDRVIPFYYTVDPALLSVHDFSRDYLTRYLCQRLAFEKKDQTLFVLDGLPMEDTASLVQERDAAWAKELLERFVRSRREPLDALRTALSAPRLSAVAAGKPVVLMIDEFQRLGALRQNGDADPRLASLFETANSSPKIHWLLTGNEIEISEMPISSRLTKAPVPPLEPEDAASLVTALLQGAGADAGAVPGVLIQRLGGNPFYLRSLAQAIGIMKSPGEADFWRAYFHEIAEGAICLFWTTIFRSFFAGLEERRLALKMLHAIRPSAEPLTLSEVSKTLHRDDAHAEKIMKALHLSGFVRGAFGVFRPSQDRVVSDFIDILYKKEMLGERSDEIEREFLKETSGAKGRGVSFELALTRARDAELVAARCLEQIGRNSQVSEEIIGQLQMALIEACINALEYGEGEEVRVGFVIDEERFTVSVESPGRQFTSLETGEPFVGKDLKEPAGRGWGIKLMKNFADEVRFENTPRGTRVVLVKHLVKSAGARTEGASP